MEVITTHLNADFDALGAMVAAKKLYPDAVLAFPGSTEKTLRQFFLMSSVYAVDVQKARHVDLDDVRRLILVDVAQSERIGRFGVLLGRPDVEVHLYDHHKGSPSDIRPTVAKVEAVGAATTVLVELLRERRVPVTREEATIMLLGIYEDTGCLTFSTTTPRDLWAAAHLLRQGADLNAVGEFLTPELTAEQVSLLDDLLKGRTNHTFHGVTVTLAEAGREQYIGDVALLVHKMKDIENLDVIVALVRMADRTYLVARSRVAEVDVSRVARAFGGGGHPSAASATVRDLTPIQVRERLLELLPRVVRPRTTARDFWTTPVKTLDPATPLSEAQDLLDRYHVNAMPVVKDERVLGIVTRQLVGRALQHNLVDVPVEEYMTTEFSVVAPDAPLAEVQDRIIRGNQRFLPVLDGGRLVGAVTRTDLLRALEGPEQTAALLLPREVEQRESARLLRERLDPGVLERLRELGRVAQGLGMSAFLVGGMVRDLFLRRENLDVDVVAEGDGIALAEAVGKRWGAAVRAHRAFGTATLVLPDGFKMDVATARTEYYPEPAALPSVESSSLKLDLFRRDFTVNTLALRLTPDRFGEVIDFFGGLRDLREGTIRVLHNLSFVEDPTRVLRALRFQLRFGFRLGRETQKLLKSAARTGFVAQARGRRLFQEWTLLFRDVDPSAAAGALHEHGVLLQLHPGLKWDALTRALFGRVREVVTWFSLLYLGTGLRAWLIYLLALLDPLSDEEVAEWGRWYGVSDREGRQLLDDRRRSREALVALREELSRGEPPRDSRIYAVLHPSEPETLLYLMAKTSDEEKRRLISRYYTKLAGVRTLLGGRDLRELGVPPGPIYRRLLGGLLDARLDGEVETREDEVAWVRAHWPASPGAVGP